MKADLVGVVIGETCDLRAVDITQRLGPAMPARAVALGRHGERERLEQRVTAQRLTTLPYEGVEIRLVAVEGLAREGRAQGVELGGHHRVVIHQIARAQGFGVDVAWLVPHEIVERDIDRAEKAAGRGKEGTAARRIGKEQRV